MQHVAGLSAPGSTDPRGSFQYEQAAHGTICGARNQYTRSTRTEEQKKQAEGHYRSAAGQLRTCLWTPAPGVQRRPAKTGEPVRSHAEPGEKHGGACHTEPRGDHGEIGLGASQITIRDSASVRGPIASVDRLEIVAFVCRVLDEADLVTRRSGGIPA